MVQTIQKDLIHFLSAAEFYDSIILNELVSHTNLKKLHLLYKAKPFDFSPSILSAIKSQPIEVPQLVFNLAKHGNLNTLPLLENSLVCTKGEIKRLSSKMDCKELYIQFIEATFTNCINSPSPQGPIPVLVRKEVGNPPTYFDKSFREYKDGFSANGK